MKQASITSDPGQAIQRQVRFERNISWDGPDGLLSSEDEEDCQEGTTHRQVSTDLRVVDCEVADLEASVQKKVSFSFGNGVFRPPLKTQLSDVESESDQSQTPMKHLTGNLGTRNFTVNDTEDDIEVEWRRRQ